MSQRGTGRARRRLVPFFFDATRDVRLVIVALLPKRNGLVLVAELHREPRARRRNRQIAIAEAAHQVEGLARRLLVGEAHRVVGDVFLDGRAHLRRHPEEAIRRYQTAERLVRALEVVRRDEERDAAVAVSVIGKDGAGEEFVPQRLPETLDFPHRLRMLGPALHVPDAVLAELLLEFRFAAPHRVLPPLVRQDFPRHAVVADRTAQCLHHQP